MSRFRITIVSASLGLLGCAGGASTSSRLALPTVCVRATVHSGGETSSSTFGGLANNTQSTMRWLLGGTPQLMIEATTAGFENELTSASVRLSAIRDQVDMKMILERSLRDLEVRREWAVLSGESRTSQPTHNATVLHAVNTQTVEANNTQSSLPFEEAGAPAVDGLVTLNVRDPRDGSNMRVVLRRDPDRKRCRDYMCLSLCGTVNPDGIELYPSSPSSKPASLSVQLVRTVR